MKRREFSKTLFGTLGAILLGPKVEEYVAPIVGRDDMAQVITARFAPTWPNAYIYMSAVNKSGERSHWVRANTDRGAGKLFLRPGFTASLDEQVRVDLRSVDYHDPNNIFYRSIPPALVSRGYFRPDDSPRLEVLEPRRRTHETT